MSEQKPQRNVVIPRNSEEAQEMLAEILPHLNHNQLRYVAVRREFANEKECAEALGLSPRTLYEWPEIVRQAADLMAYDGIMVARAMRRRALPKAMAVKVAGLDSDSERIRQDASTEIIEGEMGKALQRQETNLKIPQLDAVLDLAYGDKPREPGDTSA